MKGVGISKDQATGKSHTIYSLRHTAICQRIICSEGKVNIFNLAKNAIEAMQASPRNRRRLHMRTRIAGQDDVEVSVTDSGAGIPAGLGDNLLVPFYTTKEDGMGMGLHICRSVIEAHDGRLWHEPAPDGGTTFTFVIPVHAVSRMALRA